MTRLSMVIAAAALTIGGAAQAQYFVDDTETRSLSPAERAGLAEEVKLRLRDPESARFRWLPQVVGERLYCGFVNAKNGYGGYTGFLPFIGQVATMDGGQIYAKVSKIAPANVGAADAGVVEELCWKAGYDVRHPEAVSDGPDGEDEVASQVL